MPSALTGSGLTDQVYAPSCMGRLSRSRLRVSRSQPSATLRPFVRVPCGCFGSFGRFDGTQDGVAFLLAGVACVVGSLGAFGALAISGSSASGFGLGWCIRLGPSSPLCRYSYSPLSLRPDFGFLGRRCFGISGIWEFGHFGNGELGRIRNHAQDGRDRTAPVCNQALGWRRSRQAGSTQPNECRRYPRNKSEAQVLVPLRQAETLVNWRSRREAELARKPSAVRAPRVGPLGVLVVGCER